MFPPENISMKRGKFSYKPAFDDWSSEMRDHFLPTLDFDNHYHYYLKKMKCILILR